MFELTDSEQLGLLRGHEVGMKLIEWQKELLVAVRWVGIGELEVHLLQHSPRAASFALRR